MEKQNFLRNATEARALDLFDTEFGMDLFSRFKKVAEEFHELEAVVSEIQALESHATPAQLEHMADETSDLYATISHFAKLQNMYNTELLCMAIDKVQTRKTNPNYKRFATQAAEVVGMQLVKCVTKRELKNGASTFIIPPITTVLVRFSPGKDFCDVYAIGKDGTAGREIKNCPITSLQKVN